MRCRTVILVEHKTKMALGISRRGIVLRHRQLLADGSPDEIRNDTSVKRTTLMLEVDAWTTGVTS
jgi:branched-chain amino acid transport system ATP-binding protein